MSANLLLQCLFSIHTQRHTVMHIYSWKKKRIYIVYCYIQPVYLQQKKKCKKLLNMYSLYCSDEDGRLNKTFQKMLQKTSPAPSRAQELHGMEQSPRGRLSFLR